MQSEDPTKKTKEKEENITNKQTNKNKRIISPKSRRIKYQKMDKLKIRKSQILGRM